MRLRAFALLLVLVSAANPLFGAVCRIDCDRPPAVPTCHESVAASDGPIVRGAQHPCDHDHTTGSPARLAGMTSDSVGALVAVPAATLTTASMPTAQLTAASLHGPPGLSARCPFSLATVLRI